MKRKGHQKIDPLVATINALTVSQGEEPESGEVDVSYMLSALKSGTR
jgi:phage terminase large subunit-like protein